MVDYITNLPIEIRELIFKSINIKDIINCRLVCKKLKEFIDSDQSIWKYFCIEDYPHASLMAKFKAGDSITWQMIYKNLKMWSEFKKYRKVTKSFFTFSVSDRHHLLGIDNGLLYLKTKKGILIYDFNKAKYLPVRIPNFDCHLIKSNNLVTVMQVYKTLHIIKHEQSEFTVTEYELTANKFVLTETELWFWLHRDVYKCNLKCEYLVPELVIRSNYEIAEMQLHNKFVHLFTTCGKIVSFQNSNDVSIKSVQCHEDWSSEFQMIVPLDEKHFIYYWRNLFYIEAGNFRHFYLKFQLVSAVCFYGDNVIIGTDNGKIIIYRVSQQQLISSKPIFEEVLELPMQHIALKIDVLETRNGPIIIVATCMIIFFIEVSFHHKVISIFFFHFSVAILSKYLYCKYFQMQNAVPYEAHTAEVPIKRRIYYRLFRLCQKFIALQGPGNNFAI